MSQSIRLNPGWVFIFVLCLCGSPAKTHDVQTQSAFYQSREPTGEFMFQFNNDEIFYVDLDHRETRWRLKEFGELTTFEAAGALQNIAILRQNLDVLKQWSNFSEAANVAPNILAYPKDSVILGEPNELICMARQFFPPVIEMKWMKNNHPVSAGVAETDFYPAPDGSFSKFLYLATIPQEGEVYTCSVVHPGQTQNPTNKFWSPPVPQTFPETRENIICGLGLFIGIFGIITGIVLICKGMKEMNHGRRH